MVRFVVKSTISLVRKVAYATCLGLFSWRILLFQAGLAGKNWIRYVAAVVDWPIAAFGHFVFWEWTGVDVFFGSGLPEFGGYEDVLVQHLKAAIPAYVILFYAVEGIVLVFRRRRRRVVEEEGSDA